MGSWRGRSGVVLFNLSRRGLSNPLKSSPAWSTPPLGRAKLPSCLPGHSEPTPGRPMLNRPSLVCVLKGGDETETGRPSGRKGLSLFAVVVNSSHSPVSSSSSSPPPSYFPTPHVFIYLFILRDNTMIFLFPYSLVLLESSMYFCEMRC